METSSLVNAYYKKLEEWRQLNSLVMTPYFNATKDAEMYAKWERLNEELKVEADNLWCMSINVY